MKDNASNSSSSLKQAKTSPVWQAHAQQILPVLTKELVKLQYCQISHLRIGVHAADYQGLSRAIHSQFGPVLLKWQLSEHHCQQSAQAVSSGIFYEYGVITALSALTPYKRVAPPLLAHHKLRLHITAPPSALIVVVMPYYKNGSLSQYLKQPLPARQKHQLIMQAAQVIAQLHRAGWLHNDIKPSNILLDDLAPSHFLLSQADDSSLKADLLLTDFALATRVEASTVGHLAGTPAYLAPERWQGHAASVQSDIYAFGIMLYEILVGVRPLQIDTQSREPLKAWAVQHCQQPIPRLPPAYRHYQPIIDQALARRNKERYSNIRKCLRDLKIAY
ncbi:serine/threonine-protein kinase [Psychrobacter sp. CAM01]|uniref:serine/threonine-protein kinase n=1 Tax=Psychrobacter sp. CAM01 TaxID=3080335 RepID=UPI0029366174|nr:serine/threonine-protein kinase [Psychrobacter sp. CAM01]MDV2859163.1 serine/threonine-protein kinase [Psychrobacter sp. CAM01]